MYTLQIPKTTAKDPQPKVLQISNWKGVNQFVTPSEIEDNEFADAQNIQLADNGLPDKRNGFEQIFNTTLGTGKINGAYKGLYKSKIIFSWGTALYTQTGTNQPVSIMTGLANAKSYFFALNDILFMVNGTDFVYYNGTTAGTVASIAYIPTTVIGRAPTGGGTTLEPVNLMQPGRKNSFVGTGTATVFQLDTTNLDATTVTAVVAGTNKVEGTDFLVDRTAGTITFAVAPTNGSGVDNVVITFYKTVSGYSSKITGCTIQPVLFGGNNDSRAMMANGNIRYHSGLYDATYWPDLNYTKIGSEQNAITAFSQKDDTQIILKQQNSLDTTIWGSRYNIDNDGNVSYPVFPINGVAGSDAKCTEIILNNPVFFDQSDGIYWLNATNVKDQRAIERLSDKVNHDLLAESNKSNAVSFLWGYRYGIALNGHVYVFDFRLNAWYGKWTNINASCFFTIGSDLYFGSSSEGMLYKFNNKFNDNGQPIECYILTKYYAFGVNWYKKLLSKLYVDLKSAVAVSTKVSYITDVKSNPKYLPTMSRYLFGYDHIDYSKWTYAAGVGFPKAIMRKVREKGFIWIRFKFENNTLNESMALLSTQYEYTLQSPTKAQ